MLYENNQTNISRRNNEKTFTFRFIIKLLVITLSTFLISMYVVGFAVVCGPSMQPTLESGDVLLINRFDNTYERFDIVVIQEPSYEIIKRIIGLPGDTIQIRDGSVYINGELLNDVVDIKTNFSGMAYEELLLKEGEYFVLGDNREDSMDSRYEEIGIVHHHQIKAKVIISVTPPKIVK